MIIQLLHCPNCQGTDIVRHGQTRQGKQRYRCPEQRCERQHLLDQSSEKRRTPLQTLPDGLIRDPLGAQRERSRDFPQGLIRSTIQKDHAQ
jgi:hypothetical protein